MGTCDGGGGEPDLDTSWRNPDNVRPATTAPPEYATCGDMVQSNGTCGNACCKKDNYGKP